MGNYIKFIFNQNSNEKTTILTRAGYSVKQLIEQLNILNVDYFYALFSEDDADYINFHYKAYNSLVEYKSKINKDTLTLPIIKKWLYSDHDIFYRELISNGCDAITKLKKLDMMGEYQMPDAYKASIQVVVNPEEKTLKFIDTGLGMTAEEVEEYITQIAFSGATEFLEKYKDKTTDDDMIGHFGLGFYSAFMVADEVHIDSLSYRDGAEPVHWVSEGGTEYEMQEGNKEELSF